MRPLMAKAISYMKPDIDPNTRLYVPFNEGVGSVAKDYSQYGNHAQLTDVEWSPDGFNGAGKLNGSSSFGNCGNDSSLNITDAMTIEAFIKSDESVGTSHRTIWSFYKDANNRFYYRWPTNAFSHASMYAVINGTAYASSTVFAVGLNWHYSSVIVNGLNWKYIVDGVTVLSEDAGESIANFSNTPTFKIGCLDTYFYGTIDNVIISSTARSAAQIAADCYEVVCN